MSRTGGGLLQRIGHYTLAKVAIMAAGFISYPILTRVLTPAEYGIMGLLLTLLNVLIGVSKLGLQFSTVRLWAQWDGTAEGRTRFIASFFLATLAAGVAVTLLYDGVTLLLGKYLRPLLIRFILLSSPLIILRSLQSFGLSLLNARQWSRAYGTFEVVLAYTAMTLAVVGAAMVLGGLEGYYIGLIVGEALVVLVLVIYVLRGVSLRPANVSFSLVQAAVAFGLPMALFELSGVLLYTGDRFLILWLSDEAHLGYYTVAFNLSQYIHVIFTIPVVMAVQPAVTALYEKDGSLAASEFLRRAARYFLMFALAAMAGMTLVRHDLLGLLASSRFLRGADLLHLLLAGFLLAGVRDIVGAGMFLKKKPWLMAGLNLGGAGLNLLLNLLLVPRFSIEGAALATLVSQLVMTVVFWRLGSRLVRVRLDLGAASVHAACAVLMGLLLHLIDPGAGAMRLGLRVVSGAAMYALLLFAVDSEARGLVLRFGARLRGREPVGRASRG